MSAVLANQMEPAEGATVVITHRLRANRLAEYESWLEEIAPLCKASPGHLDWHIVRPIPGLSETYTIVIRFNSIEHLRGWMESPTRARLIEKVQHLFATGDDFFVSSGLGFLVYTGRGEGQGANTLETVSGHLVGHIPSRFSCSFVRYPNFAFSWLAE